MSNPTELAGVLDDRQRALVRATQSSVGTVAVVVDPDDDEPGLIGGSGWPDDVSPPTQDEVDMLIHVGCLEFVEADSGWAARISPLGRQVGSEIVRMAEYDEPPRAVSESALHWSALRAHAYSVYTKWLRERADWNGVFVVETSLGALDASTRQAAVGALVGEDFLAHPMGPAIRASFPNKERVYPTAKCKAYFGEYPSSPDGAKRELLAAVDEVLASAGTSEADKKKLRQVRSNLEQLAAGTAWAIFMKTVGIG